MLSNLVFVEYFLYGFSMLMNGRVTSADAFVAAVVSSLRAIVNEAIGKETIAYTMFLLPWLQE